jgi:hypothetical protein
MMITSPFLRVVSFTLIELLSFPCCLLTSERAAGASILAHEHSARIVGHSVVWPCGTVTAGGTVAQIGELLANATVSPVARQRQKDEAALVRR